MTMNVTQIHIAQNTEEILSCESFRRELDAIRERKEREEEQAHLEAEAKRLKQEKQLLLSKEAANDWNRLILQMVKTAIADGLHHWMTPTMYSFEVSPAELMLNAKSSLLARSLESLGLENKWYLKTSGYVDGTSTLRDYGQAVHPIGSDFCTWSHEERGWYTGKRYYGCDSVIMHLAEHKKDTFMHLFAKLITEVLEQHGYKVKNSIKLQKTENSKATYEWDGEIKVVVE